MNAELRVKTELDYQLINKIQTKRKPVCKNLCITEIDKENTKREEDDLRQVIKQERFFKTEGDDYSYRKSLRVRSQERSSKLKSMINKAMENTKEFNSFILGLQNQ